MPTTYPIHPGDRLQSRIVTVLSDSFTDVTAFDGTVYITDRDDDEQTFPMIIVRLGESQNQPVSSHVWHVTVTVQLLEDRAESQGTIAGDTRPRHDLRAENLSARLFGSWDGSKMDDDINAISNGNGVYVLKIYNQGTASMNDIDMISTEYTLTAICTATQQ